MLNELRHGFRMLLKNPGFTIVTVITLALGIGANTAIFTVVNAVLLRSLYNQDPHRLVKVWQRFKQQSGFFPFSAPDYLDIRNENQSFVWMGAFTVKTFLILGGSEPEGVTGARVEPRLFPLLGAEPALGRNFLLEEGQLGKNRVVLLSHGLWQRRFGGDPGLLGRAITVDGQSYAVVGIMKPYFQFPSGQKEVPAEQYDAWVPLAFEASELSQAGAPSMFQVIAYLKSGITLKQAQAEMETLARRIGQKYPNTNSSDFGATVVPLHEEYVGNIRPALLVLLGAVGLVLLIACANVANLQLARTAARQREIAIRSALGASRLRVMGQLLSESVLLAGLGGLVGLLLAYWGTDLLVSLIPETVQRLWKISVDGRVLCFTLGVSLLTGVLFGLTPALEASRVDLNASLKEAGRSLDQGFRRHLLRRLLLVSEVALSFVLLIGAGLLIHSFLRLVQTDRGFRSENILTLQPRLSESKYANPDQRTIFYQEVLKRIEALPGVESAAATTDLPLGGGLWGGDVTLGNEADLLFKVREAVGLIAVTPNYFRAMATPLRIGRYFTEQDRTQASRVVIINESMARHYWPGENPLGKRMGLFLSGLRQKPTWAEIVGVVGDVKHFGLEEEVPPVAYLPDLRLNPYPWITYVVHSSTDPLALAKAARHEIQAVDKDTPVQIRTMEQWLSSSLTKRRFNTLLLGIFAAVAMVLAAVGIYGVIAYSVTQRTHEIGVRVALGAQSGDVLRLVVGQGLVLILIGVGIGLAAAFPLTRVLSSMLYGVTATDPATFVAVSLLLTGVALLASYIPARRATRVDPLVALRWE